jgi:predicted NBD/HSP70 family sugar kinase
MDKLVLTKPAAIVIGNVVKIIKPGTTIVIGEGEAVAEETVIECNGDIYMLEEGDKIKIGEMVDVPKVIADSEKLTPDEVSKSIINEDYYSPISIDKESQTAYMTKMKGNKVIMRQLIEAAKQKFPSAAELPDENIVKRLESGRYPFYKLKKHAAALYEKDEAFQEIIDGQLDQLSDGG